LSPGGTQRPIASTIDAMDARVVALLQQDARQPNTSIARALGVAEATVRSRIARLVGERVLRFGVWVDPLKVGHQTYAIIQIQVNQPDVEQVGSRLAGFPEIFFMGVSTGAYDIHCAALFRSNDHMYEFMSQRLRRVPGIQRTETSHIVRILKREFPNPLAGVGSEVRQESRRRGIPRDRPRRGRRVPRRGTGG
jgi:Lrp/AsnC family transcriptional regulator for asnA, asnC and gidA